MKKPVITFAVSAMVGIGTIFGGSSFKTHAESISSLQDHQHKIQNQQLDLNSKVNQANQQINNIQGQQNDVMAEMKRIDLAIGDIGTRIRDKQTRINETNAQVTKLDAEIKVIQDRIKKRDDLLKERFRNYQETGGMVNYIEVLIGSQSFSDFIDRANAVATIMEADQELLKQAAADKKDIETKQGQVKNELANLKNMLKDLENMNQQLNAHRAQKDKLLASLESQKQKVQEDVMNMQEQNQVFSAQVTAIQKAIQVEHQRQAELERQRQAAAQASPPGVSAAPPVTGGFFMRPATGPISSTYGPRWGSFHYGVDIANPGANVPIVAAGDGVVAVSHYSDSYGNVVYITHSVNGHIYTTVYAHMSVRMVSEGQVVHKGQQIGIMGSTGEATGQHLHFELYDGPWKYHSGINPMGMVPL